MDKNKCINNSGLISKSYWLDSTYETKYPILNKDMEKEKILLIQMYFRYVF